jgi:hypothetical protein
MSEEEKLTVDEISKSPLGMRCKATELTVDEIKDMIVQGKISINDIIKSLVNSIAPKKRGRKKKVVPDTEETLEQKKERHKAYYKEYYKKNKQWFADNYKNNRSEMNERSKTQYRIKKMKELASADTTRTE